MPSSQVQESKYLVDDVVGRTITRVEYADEDELRLFFDDGSMLYVSGVWHNDSTAGTMVSLMRPDDPKSYADDEDFYDLTYDRWTR